MLRLENIPHRSQQIQKQKPISEKTPNVIPLSENTSVDVGFPPKNLKNMQVLQQPEERHCFTLLTPRTLLYAGVLKIAPGWLETSSTPYGCDHSKKIPLQLLLKLWHLMEFSLRPLLK